MLSMNHMAVLMMFGFAFLIGVGMLLMSAFLGRVKPDPKKLSIYECGVPSSGTPHDRFSVKFYLFAIFFLIFDIEVVFLYPWAFIFKHQIAQSPVLIVEMFLFIGILIVGYLYIWKKGALRWD
ncbi:MAG: hypothetical protein A3D19_05910 [Deltaproteobacteria bacterium RIFCSPHIGHO2_02_FULL_38_15]|nr:MAG: hypothetical protein A3D19_05910 [Deltaproteobacteria bacterium RIFCSPHIGHO2_02_FULL_38_15]OGQ34439.1 MAG: hypothetical protein A3A72_00980 [Deltaproteobacteria bacterium RIFCSPLOWO2_01_FULL_38_9]OGQ63794.1 MAG: hypothetical protein A3G92_06700 [Deltaproteobacteria bacterium RIFCSPLOWO2_12_FULL_38_8]